MVPSGELGTLRWLSWDTRVKTNHKGHDTETITSFEGEARRSFALPERWRLQRVLGVGGQAEVWLAFDTELQEHVAVKV
ncbi:MAG: hypothetical protein DRJ65_03780, partial [Acidobacteria bacterium]